MAFRRSISLDIGMATVQRGTLAKGTIIWLGLEQSAHVVQCQSDCGKPM